MSEHRKSPHTSTMSKPTILTFVLVLDTSVVKYCNHSSGVWIKSTWLDWTIPLHVIEKMSGICVSVSE